MQKIKQDLRAAKQKLLLWKRRSLVWKHKQSKKFFSLLFLVFNPGDCVVNDFSVQTNSPLYITKLASMPLGVRWEG